MPDQSRGDEQVRQPEHDNIAALAHLIWLHEGRPQGHALDHWATAECILAASLDRYALEEQCERRAG